jgi:hypothetical protein
MPNLCFRAGQHAFELLLFINNKHLMPTKIQHLATISTLDTFVSCHYLLTTLYSTAMSHEQLLSALSLHPITISQALTALVEILAYH